MAVCLAPVGFVGPGKEVRQGSIGVFSRTPSEGLSPSDSYSNQGDFSAPVVVPLDPPAPNIPDSAEPISSINSIDQVESGAIETSSQDADQLSVAGYIDDSIEHLNTNQSCSSQLNGWYFGAGAAVVGTLVYPPGGLVLSVALLTSRLCLSPPVYDESDCFTDNELNREPSSVSQKLDFVLNHWLCRNFIETALPVLIGVMFWKLSSDNRLNDQDQFLLNGNSNEDYQKAFVGLNVGLYFWSAIRILTLFIDTLNHSSFHGFTNKPLLQKLGRNIKSREFRELDEFPERHNQMKLILNMLLVFNGLFSTFAIVAAAQRFDSSSKMLLKRCENPEFREEFSIGDPTSGECKNAALLSYWTRVFEDFSLCPGSVLGDHRVLEFLLNEKNDLMHRLSGGREHDDFNTWPGMLVTYWSLNLLLALHAYINNFGLSKSPRPIMVSRIV